MANVQEVNRLGALNLRQETTKLEEWELVKLVNFDISRKPGTLCLRRGRDFQYVVSVSQVIRQVAKVNGFRYQVAGTQLFRDGEAIVRELADELETNIQSFRPLDDTTIWAFIADDNIMAKDDGERTYIWGLQLLPLPGPKVANQTGKDAEDTITAGTYGIAVTQVRWDTSESNPLLAI